MSFATALEKATNESHQTEEWQAIMDFSDKVNATDESGRNEAVQALTRRLNHANTQVQLHTITVLSACVKNCGRAFQVSLCNNREFLSDVKRIINSIKSDVTVVTKLKNLLLEMQKEFKDSPQRTIAGVINSLKESGIAFDDGKPVKPAAASASSGSARDREDAELQRALAESLKLAESKPPQAKGLGKARALYDFDAREENELGVRAGEVVTLLDTSDSNWWRGRNAAGDEGCFPASYVTTDASAAVEGGSGSASAAPARPQSQEINEPLLDQLMKSIAQLTPGQQPPPQLEELMAAHNAMKPAVKAKVAACAERKRNLEDACGRFNQVMARYDAMMQAPLPPPPQPYYAPTVAPGYSASPMADPRLAASAYGATAYPGPASPHAMHSYASGSAPGYHAASPVALPPGAYAHHSPSPAVVPPAAAYSAVPQQPMAAWQYGGAPRN